MLRRLGGDLRVASRRVRRDQASPQELHGAHTRHAVLGLASHGHLRGHVPGHVLGHVLDVACSHAHRVLRGRLGELVLRLAAIRAQHQGHVSNRREPLFQDLLEVRRTCHYLRTLFH